MRVSVLRGSKTLRRYKARSRRAALFPDVPTLQQAIPRIKQELEARVRALIEQLDTPGRAGGNIFIIYLKNAEASRVASRLRRHGMHAQVLQECGVVGAAAQVAHRNIVACRRQRRPTPP